MSSDSCGIGEPVLLTYEQAIERLLAAARPVEDVERLPLRAARGRVLAEGVTSAIAVPGWDYSAMDGYAVRAADVAAGGATLAVSQRVPAGSDPRPLLPGTAARIFTGAPIPEGADTVVVQEVCRQGADAVTVPALKGAGANIRRRGEDIAQGDLILRAGLRLQPQHLGLAASVGEAELPVRRRLRVAVLASGDELVMPGEPLRPGTIYNSNLFTATGLLQALGCEVLDRGVVADTAEATREALAAAAAEADLVLASGGVSVGEEDHIKPAVESLGRLDMWRLAIRPGKPLAFGWIGGTPFLGAPGNPVSLFVTFLLFARPFILARMGVAEPLPRPLQATAHFDWPSPDRRREFHRARIVTGRDGRPSVEVHPSRSSGVLSSVVWANGLVVIPEGRVIRRGDPVDFLPFAELLA
jgi:molybdopterin molybdotransferase